MRVPKLVLAFAVAATSMAVVPSFSFGMECLQMCAQFLPKKGVTDPSGYSCQDLIDDSGGFCTINGRLNLTRDLPKPGILYNKRYGQPLEIYGGPGTDAPILKY